MRTDRLLSPPVPALLCPQGCDQLWVSVSVISRRGLQVATASALCAPCPNRPQLPEMVNFDAYPMIVQRCLHRSGAAEHPRTITRTRMSSTPKKLSGELCARIQSLRPRATNSPSLSCLDWLMKTRFLSRQRPNIAARSPSPWSMSMRCRSRRRNPYVRAEARRRSRLQSGPYHPQRERFPGTMSRGFPTSYAPASTLTRVSSHRNIYAQGARLPFRDNHLDDPVSGRDPLA